MQAVGRRADGGGGVPAGAGEHWGGVGAATGEAPAPRRSSRARPGRSAHLTAGAPQHALRGTGASQGGGAKPSGDRPLKGPADEEHKGEAVGGDPWRAAGGEEGQAPVPQGCNPGDEVGESGPETEGSALGGRMGWHSRGRVKSTRGGEGSPPLTWVGIKGRPDAEDEDEDAGRGAIPHAAHTCKAQKGGLNLPRGHSN